MRKGNKGKITNDLCRNEPNRLLHALLVYSLLRSTLTDLRRIELVAGDVLPL